MSNQVFLGPDPVRSRLRATVATIQEAIARLPEATTNVDGSAPADALRAAWVDLVAQLALGPEPPLRECPHCGHSGIRAATLCSNCWQKLVPPA